MASTNKKTTTKKTSNTAVKKTSANTLRGSSKSASKSVSKNGTKSISKSSQLSNQPNRKSNSSSISANKSTSTNKTNKTTKTQSENILAQKSTNPDIKSSNKPGKKSTPTPKRSTQQAKKINPIVKVNPNRKNLTKDERKKIRIERQAEAAAFRKKESEALSTGNQKYLPLKDQGPARRYTRELVDEKTTPLEFFVFIAAIMLIVSIFTQSSFPVITFYITILTYIYIAISLVFAFFRVRKIKKQVIESFGNDKKITSGLSSYIFYRMTQPKKLRLPKVGV